MSKITVTTIAGATSGADANKVKIESGDDLVVNTDTLFVDASADKVGINQASPTYQLSVLGATQSTVEIESASSTGESRLYFTDPDATGTGEVGYYHNGDTMRFATGGVERMRLSSAGLHIGGTGAANALGDYEEGTWTPNVYNHGYSSNWTTKKGDYIKVGKVVHCWFVCDHGNSNSGSGTGNLTIQGMPFTLSAEATSGSSFAHNSTQSVGMWSANPSSQVGNIFCHGNTSTFLLYKGGSNIQSQVTFVTGSFSYIAG